MRWSCTGRRMINLTTSLEVGCHSETLVDSGARAVCNRGRNSKRFLIKTLGTAVLFALVSSVSFATAKRTVLSEEPEKFARTLVNLGIAKPTFLYCWADIHYFDNVDSENCANSVVLINRLAKSASIIPMVSTDSETLRRVVDEVFRSMERK